MLTIRRAGSNFAFDVNCTFSKALENNIQVHNNSATVGNPLEPNVEYGPSHFDHRQMFDAFFVYNLPKSYKIFPRAVNYVLGGCSASGIATVLSGSPVYVTISGQVWGGGQQAVANSGFGVISSTVVPANRQASSRWLMASLRLEF